MDRNLSIQQIQTLATIKAANPQLSDTEAIRIMDTVIINQEITDTSQWNLVSSNKSSFDNNILVSGISDCDGIPSTAKANAVANNLLQKLGYIKPSEITVQESVQVQPKEPTEHEIKTFASNYLKADTEKGLKLFYAQKYGQGSVSNFYDNLKVFFDTDFASTRISRILSQEALIPKLLELAGESQLSQKEYLETKLELALRLLGAETQEVKYLEKEFSRLKPFELNNFISKITNLNDDDYKKKIPEVKENLINNAVENEKRENKPKLLDLNHFFNIDLKNPNSVEGILINKDSNYKLMSYEEVFVLERGVKYNPDAVTHCAEKETTLSLILAADYGSIKTSA